MQLFDVLQGSVKSKVIMSGYQPTAGLTLDVLLVWGVSQQPSAATVNGQPALVRYTPALQVINPLQIYDAF